MRALWTMTLGDLRQRVRDKSVFVFGLVVPLALMTVLNLLMGDLDNTELDDVTVAASAQADDQLAAQLLQTIGQIEEPAVTLEEVPADQVQDQVDSGDAALGLVVPEGFGAEMAAGDGPSVEFIQGGDSGLGSDVVISVAQGVLDQFTAATVAANAGAAAGVPPDQLPALGQQAATAGPALTMSEGEVAAEQLTTQGTLVAGQAGLFLLFTVGFGVLSLLAEREQGTLPRLRSMPMRPGTVVAAKGVVSFILGVVTTSLLLGLGSLFFGVSFGSPVAVAVLVLCVVTAGTSLMFIVARIARTAEQANVAQSILAIVLGMASGAFFPIQATGVAGAILDLNPIAAFVRGLGITSGGGDLADLGVPIAYMLVFAVVFGLASRLVPDRGVAA